MAITATTVTTKTTTTSVALFRKSTAALVDGYLIVGTDGSVTRWEPAPPGSTDIDDGRTFLRDKKGQGIQKVYEGGIRWASKLNIKPGQNISERLQRVISDLTEEEYGTPLLLDHGLYDASDIKLGSTAMGLVCMAGKATLRGERILSWEDGKGRELLLSSIGFLGLGKDRGVKWRVSDEELNENDPLLVENALLYGKGVLCLQNACSIAESYAHGLVLEGWQDDLHGPAKSNASGSLISGAGGRNVFASNRGYGLLIVGNNANGVANIYNDYRDNGGGSRDASQVGGKCTGNIYHPNPLFGDNVMDGSGCTGSVYDNYYEERGSGKPNRYGGQCRVRDTHRNGTPIYGPYVDYIEGNSRIFSQSITPDITRRLYKDSTSMFSQEVQKWHLVRQPGTNDVRLAPLAVTDISVLMIRGKMVCLAIPSIEIAQKSDVFFEKGDTAIDSLGQHYLLGRGGNGGRPLLGFTGTVDWNSAGRVILESELGWGDEVTQWLIGATITVAGYDVKVWSLYDDPNNRGKSGKGRMVECPPQDAIAIKESRWILSQPVSYPTPEFIPLLPANL